MSLDPEASCLHCISERDKELKILVKSCISMVKQNRDVNRKSCAAVGGME